MKGSEIQEADFRSPKTVGAPVKDKIPEPKKEAGPVFSIPRILWNAVKILFAFPTSLFLDFFTQRRINILKISSRCLLKSY